MIDFETELKEHIEYLSECLKNLPGVEQGYLVKNNTGDIVDRVGRMSLNPQWYRDFYKQYGRKPYKRELEQLARQHLEEGFYDTYGYIPPLRERMYEFA